jgi:hypothetical protein
MRQATVIGQFEYFDYTGHYPCHDQFIHTACLLGNASWPDRFWVVCIMSMSFRRRPPDRQCVAIVAYPVISNTLMMKRCLHAQFKG